MLSSRFGKTEAPDRWKETTTRQLWPSSAHGGKGTIVLLDYLDEGPASEPGNVNLAVFVERETK